jgi:HNH endonuclease
MPIELTCKNCGNTFKAKPKDAGRLYCGIACNRAYESAHGREATRMPLVEFSCRQCGKPFFMKPSYLKEHRKRHGKDPAYCSIPCSALGRRADAEARQSASLVCIQCGGPITDLRKPSGYLRRGRCLCSSECRATFRRLSYQAKFPDGNSTPRVGRNGYIRWVVPGKDGEPARETFLHRHVMEQHIGRRLRPEETVHHVNGDRSFNELSNLELFFSRHGPGQRVRDKVAFAIEMLRLYPEFAREAGVELHDVQRLRGA